jgi:hypothetical protein
MRLQLSIRQTHILPDPTLQTQTSPAHDKWVFHLGQPLCAYRFCVLSWDPLATFMRFAELKLLAFFPDPI